MLGLFIHCSSTVTTIDLTNSAIPNTLVNSLNNPPKYEWQYIYLTTLFAICILLLIISGAQSYLDGDSDDFDLFSKILYFATILASLVGIGNCITSFIISSQETYQFQFLLSILIGTAIGFACFINYDQQREELWFDRILRASIFLNILGHLTYSAIGFTVSFFSKKDKCRSQLLKDLYLSNTANTKNMQYIKSQLDNINNEISTINQEIADIKEKMLTLVTLEDIKNALLLRPTDFTDAFNSTIAYYIKSKNEIICDPILDLIYESIPKALGLNSIQYDMANDYYYYKSSIIPYSDITPSVGPIFENAYKLSNQKEFIPTVDLYNKMINISNLIALDDKDKDTGLTMYNSKNIPALDPNGTIGLFINNFTVNFSPSTSTLSNLPSNIGLSYINNAYGNVMDSKFNIYPNLRTLLNSNGYLVMPTKVSFTNKYQIIVYRDTVGQIVYESVYIFHPNFVCILSGGGYTLITCHGTYTKSPTSLQHTELKLNEYMLGNEIARNINYQNNICSQYVNTDKSIFLPQTLNKNTDPIDNSISFGNNILISKNSTQTINLVDNDYIIDPQNPQIVLYERTIQESQVLLSSVTQEVYTINQIKIYFNQNTRTIDSIKIHNGNMTQNESDYSIYSLRDTTNTKN